MLKHLRVPFSYFLRLLPFLIFSICFLTRSTSLCFQARNLLPPTCWTGGTVTFFAAMWRFSVIIPIPSIFAASRVE